MCIFAEPVHRVSNTKLYIAPNADRTRQLTVYEMKVELAGDGNAMILPVRGNVEDVGLIDMTDFQNFFAYVEEVFQAPTRSLSFGTKGMNYDDDCLVVHDIGSYKVSLAPTIDDLDRLDPEVFTVSKAAKNALRASQDGHEGGFVVAVLTQSGEYHPLAYTSTIVDGKLFVPTRHEHGSNMPMVSRVVSRITGHEMADWDHDIYYVGGPTFDQVIGTHNPATKSINSGAFSRLLREAEVRVGGIAGYIDPEQTMYHLHYAGPGNNTDLTLPVAASVAA